MKKNTKRLNSRGKFLFKVIICLILLYIVFFIVQEKVNFLAVFANEEISERDETKEYNEKIIIHNVEYYDEIIKTKYTNTELSNKDYELLVLQRNLVNNAGLYTINEFVNQSEDNKNTFDWLFNNVDVLRMYTMGGKPTGSYTQSFKVLNDLYKAYKNDLNDNTKSQLGNRYGDIYQKMMITLSLTHSKTVRFWLNDRIVQENGETTNNTDLDSKNISNAVIRYEVYKKMFLAGKLENRIFEQLEVEEMRYVMSTELSDYEIEWLRDYTTKNRLKTPFKYIKYNLVDSYWIPELYSQENREKWETKYDLTGYDIEYKSYYPHLWTVFELGGVCWHISNCGQNISASYGVPSTTVGQPGHLAFMNYTLDDKGNVKWELLNDSKGWEKTDYTGYSDSERYHELRMMNNWGSGDYASEYNSTYLLLSQSAINDFENYQKSQELIMLANSYNGNLMKQEEIYRKALEVQNINLDGWLGLINVYKANNSKNDNDYYNLARDVVNNLRYYPLPMCDMLKLISDEIKTQEYKSSFVIIKNNALKKVLLTNETQNVQADVVKIMANYLLNDLDSKIANFSFDGNQSAVLKLGSVFENTIVLWEYSLDGGKSWSETNQHSVEFVNEQIDSISADMDIRVHIVGTPIDDESIYLIDIDDYDIGDDDNHIGDKVFVFYSEIYNIKSGFISGISPKILGKVGTTVSEFKENVVSSENLVFLDKSGIILDDDDFICTGDVLKVGDNLQYVLIVDGDIDGDGEVTINDIAKLKLYCIDGDSIDCNNLMAFDVDGDGEVTINDIAKIKLMVIGLDEF